MLHQEERAAIERKKRKVHTSEFEAKAGLEALRGAKTINGMGQEYGVHPAQVGQWKKEIQEQAKTLFERGRGPGAIGAHQEPALLCSEIGKRKVELDRLKKKSGGTARDDAVAVVRQCALERCPV